MSGKTIGKSLNFGFAGNYARQPDMVIGTLCVDGDSENIKYGEAVFLTDDGNGTRYTAGMTADKFVGVAASEIKSAFTYNSMEGEYAPQQAASVMKRGAISVICKVGTPMMGGPVYLRTEANDAYPDGYVGGFEADEDTGKTILIPNAVWVTGKDSNCVAELLLKSINLI